MRNSAFALLFCVATVLPARAEPCSPAETRSVCVSLDQESDLVLELVVEDPSGNPANPVAAFSIEVDGSQIEQLLLFQGTGRRSYEAIVGPLAAGSHRVVLGDSAFWPTPTVTLRNLSARVVSETDPDFLLLHHAPAIWARADTIGRATDLLLTMYAEQTHEADGSITLTYSTIFSNEDGGTSTRALMARWGRTTDIEWMDRIRLSSGHIVSEEYQAANHDTRPFSGERLGSHSLIRVATLNNVFADAGKTDVLLRPVPVAVDLGRATRESVMDSQPWTYRVMSRELVAEGKVRTPDREGSTSAIDDPRSYVYVEGELELHNAAIAAVVEDGGGTMHTSHQGIADLSVARDGFVRIAVAAGGATPRAIGWTCLSQENRSPDTSVAQCRATLLRAFKLSDTYEIEPIPFPAIEFRLAGGETDTTPVSR